MRHATQTSRDAPCTINPTATPTCSSTPGRGRAYDRLWHEVKYGPVLNLSAYWGRPEVIGARSKRRDDPQQTISVARRSPSERLTDASQPRRRLWRARPVSFVVGDTPSGALFPLGP